MLGLDGTHYLKNNNLRKTCVKCLLHFQNWDYVLLSLECFPASYFIRENYRKLGALNYLVDMNLRKHLFST
jgi:hypothetical protein